MQFYEEKIARLLRKAQGGGMAVLESTNRWLTRSQPRNKRGVKEVEAPH